LLLLEHETFEVRELGALGIAGSELLRRRPVREVDDREVRVGKGLRGLVRRIAHQEPVRDDDVGAVTAAALEVRNVIRVLVRLDDSRLDAELRLRLVEPLRRQLVEAVVVQATDVGDETRLDLLSTGRLPAGRGRTGGAAAAPAAR